MYAKKVSNIRVFIILYKAVLTFAPLIVILLQPLIGESCAPVYISSAFLSLTSNNNFCKNCVPHNKEKW